MFFKSQFCFLDDDLWLKQRYIYMFHDDDALTLIKPVHRQGNIYTPGKDFSQSEHSISPAGAVSHGGVETEALLSPCLCCLCKYLVGWVVR